MLHAIVFLGWLFARPPAVGRGPSSPTTMRAAFDVSEEIVRVRTAEDMLRLCDAGSTIHGCTRFVGESLVPEYSRSDAGQWRMTLKGQMVALIIVRDLGVVGHEMLHVEDMKTSVERMLLAMEERSYPSRNACVGAAAALVGNFHSELAKMAAQSNAKLQ